MGAFAPSLVTADGVVLVFDDGPDGVAAVLDGTDGVAAVFDGVDDVAAVFGGGAVAVAVVLSALGGVTGEQRASALPRAGRPHLPLAMSRRASSTSVSVQSDICVSCQRRKGQRNVFVLNRRQPTVLAFTVVRMTVERLFAKSRDK